MKLILKCTVVLLSFPLLTLAFFWSSFIRRLFWVLPSLVAFIFRTKQSTRVQRIIAAVLLFGLMNVPANLPHMNFLGHMEDMERRVEVLLLDAGAGLRASILSDEQVTQSTYAQLTDQTYLNPFNRAVPTRPKTSLSDTDARDFFTSRGADIVHYGYTSGVVEGSESVNLNVDWDTRKMVDLFPYEPYELEEFSPLMQAKVNSNAMFDKIPFPKLTLLVLALFVLYNKYAQVVFEHTLVTILRKKR